jgi:heme exporter protein C
MHSLAKPSNFIRLYHRLQPWLAVACVLFLVVGLWQALVVSPPDYQQGETIRIMFIHVPSAWMAMFVYAGMSLSALGTLIWRHPMADVAQKCAAPLGAGFTLLCLVTGSLWGKPMWGTWWEWDARMTSVLVMFLIYIGVIALQQAIEEPNRAGRAVAILTLVGAVNLPIIKFSVDWWSTLHQPASVFRMDGPTIHGSMLGPLFVMGIAFLLLYITLLMLFMRAEVMNRRAERLELLAAEAE